MVKKGFDKKMVYFFQIVVSGVVVGSIYALSALGFVLIYKSSKVLNIAHGQIIASGAFIAYALTVFAGIHIVLSFLLSMVITFFLAMSVERIFLRRLIGEPIISVIMVIGGCYIVIAGGSTSGESSSLIKGYFLAILGCITQGVSTLYLRKTTLVLKDSRVYNFYNFINMLLFSLLILPFTD